MVKSSKNLLCLLLTIMMIFSMFSFFPQADPVTVEAAEIEVEEVQGNTKYAPATSKSSNYTSKYYPKYTGSATSIITALDALDINSDKNHRTKIAVFNGMVDYQLTADENNQLLKLLKAGTLLNPDYVATSTTSTTAGSTKYPPATDKCSDITTKYYPKYTGSQTSLSPALSEMGIKNSVNHRTKIAVFNGMTDYQLTPEQNNELLKMLKAGTLLNPDYNGSSSTTATTKPTTASTAEATGNTNTTKYPAATTKTSSYTSKYYPACGSSYTQLVDALNSLSITSDKYHRTKIAVYNGLTKYQLTPEENTQLLNMLKEGNLLNPDYTGSSSGDTGTTDPTESVTPATSKSSDYTSKYYPAYTGTSSSLTTAMNSMSITSTKAHRLKIAIFNGMSDYTFTPEQNTQLLSMLKAGTLLNPDYTAKITYYPKYTGTATSIVTALNSLGIDSSKDHRMKIALSNGMPDYSYLPEENTAMLNLLKQGKLIDPDNSNVSVPAATSPAGGSSGGSTADGAAYDSAYEGGAAGTGKILYHGIDVSKWNEKDGDYSDVDFSFSKAKSAGMDYVIIRAGSTNALEDPMFDKYYDAAKKAGLDVGAYFYSYAMTASEAKSDANKFLSYIKGKTFEYPCYLDFEEAKQRDDLTKAQKTTVCLTFMDIIADAGYMTGVYTGKSMSGGMDIATICARYELWIAHYYDDTYSSKGANGSAYSKNYGMYQYTSQKSISGITGVMDANVCYKDYPALTKKYGFNGYSNGGWKSTTSGKRYMYNDGTYATGWFTDGSSKYYLNPKNSGYAVTGLNKISGVVYNFTSAGVLSKTCGSVGDADASGSIKVSDVTYLQKVAAGIVTSVSDEIKMLADVDGDGKLTVRDATYIQGYLAKKITTFPGAK